MQENPPITASLSHLLLSRLRGASTVHAEPPVDTRQAYRDFGKASGHPAKLNFGDCFSYALAKTKGEPLLFKGQDFSRTDLKSSRAGVPRLVKLGKNGKRPICVRVARPRRTFIIPDVCDRV